MPNTTVRRQQRGSTPWLILILVALLSCGCGKGESSTSQSNDLFLEAKASLAAGDNAKALDLLNQSITVEPALWSYRERAKLHSQMGNDQAGLDDCEAALQLAPDDPDTLWLKAEFAKPAAQRFQGNFKAAPSSNR